MARSGRQLNSTRPNPTPGGAEFQPGDALGKYVIARKIGQGAFGIVYRAVDTSLGRSVALKVLPPAEAGDAKALRHFVREAQAAARLNHDNVISIYEIDKQSGIIFIAMELAPKGSAKDWVTERGPFSWRNATRLVAGACRGLAAAHAVGLVHRDVKPSNLLISRKGSAKLADFGLVKFRASTMSSLTVPTQVIGTPHYMSPEQCRSETVDDRSDLYSLGATYSHLLTGQPPYAEVEPMMILFAHCSKPIPDPRAKSPALPEECAAIVQRAMAKEPANRFADANAMLAELEALLPKPKALPESAIPVS